MEQVEKIFKELNINYSIVKHKALFKAGDEDDLNIEFDGVVYKNLFLRTKKKDKFFLVSLPLNKRADLKEISDKLESGRLSFGNENELWDKLHILPGSVSLLNVINVPDTSVEFVIDNEVLGIEKVAFHPNDNTATISFEINGIDKILDFYGKKFSYIEI